MYTPIYQVNPTNDSSGNPTSGYVYPKVVNVADLVSYLNNLNPTWGVSTFEDVAGGRNPFTNAPNMSPGGQFQAAIAKIPYLKYANGASEEAYQVAQIFTHGYGGYYLALQLKYEIEGTMALWDQYQQGLKG